MSMVETTDVLVGLVDAAALGEVSVPDYAHLVRRGEVVWEFEVAGKGLLSVSLNVDQLFDEMSTF